MSSQILALQGVSNDSRVRVTINADGILQVVMSGGINAASYLQQRGWQVESLLLAPNDERQQHTVKKASLLLNEISDADSHSIALSKAISVRNQFSNLYCLNEPSAIAQTTRDQVSAQLQDIAGVKMPKTLRLQVNHPSQIAAAMQKQFSGPVLFRKAGDHNGVSTVLLTAPDALDPVYRLALDGSAFYMSEFCDFRSPDGHYRKYRLAVVDGEPILRHMIVSDHWMIHSGSRQFMAAHPELEAEEKSTIERFETDLKPELQDRVQAVRDRLKLDYFGIDANLQPDGALLIFEANANMNMLINTQPLPNIWEAQVDKILQALTQLLQQKVPS